MGYMKMNEDGSIDKKGVWQELDKANFTQKQLDAIKYLTDWIEQIEGAIDYILEEYMSKEDILNELREHRHLQDGKVVKEI